MFTGIVQACGRVARVKQTPYGIRLVIDPGQWPADGVREGDSICVSGVCLTVAAGDGQAMGFDVVAETLSKTTLQTIKQGDPVNLEAAVTPSTPMGGHFVQGHIDGMGSVTRVDRSASGCRITVRPLAGRLTPDTTDLMEAIVPKGSVAVDGISLTVAAVGPSGFEMALIPTTLERTTLGHVRETDLVNLETDIVSRTIVHWLRDRYGDRSGLTTDALQRAGFTRR